MMLSSLPSSGAQEMDQRASPSSQRTQRGSSKSLERKASTKIASLPEEKSQRPEQPQEMKTPSQRGESDLLARSDAKIRLLEKEIGWAKESENKMLESLMSQTKQLEETKIELEEAKLEIRSLQEAIRELESALSDSRSSTNLGKHLEKGDTLDPVRAQEEIARLRNELKLAMEAEEKSKKAMDDLAEALKEVAGESHQAKERLLAAQTELSDMRADLEYTKKVLKMTEEDLRLAMEDIHRLKMEAEESAASWNTKQEGFRDCMKSFEEEITHGKQENSKLIEAQKASKEEVSKLRDIMKHALNEATIVKEALEIARKENSQLKDIIAEKDITLQKIKNEFECLKISEAAAQGSTEELKNLLAATADFEPSKTTASLDNGSLVKSEVAVPQMKEQKAATGFPLEASKEGHRIFDSGRNASDVRTGSLRFPPVNGAAYSEHAKDRRYGSFGSFSMRRGPLNLPDDASGMHSDDFDHKIEAFSGELQADSGSPTKKKRPMFRRITNIWRRKSDSSRN